MYSSFSELLKKISSCRRTFSSALPNFIQGTAGGVVFCWCQQKQSEGICWQVILLTYISPCYFKSTRTLIHSLFPLEKLGCFKTLALLSQPHSLCHPITSGLPLLVLRGWRSLCSHIGSFSRCVLDLDLFSFSHGYKQRKGGGVEERWWKCAWVEAITRFSFTWRSWCSWSYIKMKSHSRPPHTSLSSKWMNKELEVCKTFGTNLFWFRNPESWPKTFVSEMGCSDLRSNKVW